MVGTQARRRSYGWDDSSESKHGRGAFHFRVKVNRQGLLDDVEVIMPARVAIRQARNLSTESLRFPEQG